MATADARTEPTDASGPARREEQPTLASGPRAQRREEDPGTLPEPSELSGATLDPVRALMHREEASRARNFGRVIASLTGTASVVVLLLGGHRPLQALALASTVALFAVAVWIWRHEGASARYSARSFRVFGWTAVCTAVCLCLYFGLFSPTPMAATLGITFFGTGTDRRFAHALSLSVTAAWFLLALLVTAGVLPDLGVFAVGRGELLPRLAMLVLVPGVLLATLWQARVSRKSLLLALQRAQDAQREAGRREALLQEVHFDFEQARRDALGAQGRYTGTRAGPYTLGAVLGRGAMGEVYRARSEEGAEVALKVLSAASAQDPELRARFAREKELTTSLSSPHLVRGLGAGELPDGAPYLLLELLEGKDLAALLRQRRQLSLGEAVTLAAQVSEGLAAAHAAGVVHRDLKPQNLFLAESEGGPCWKVLDFGVAGLDASSGTLTRQTVVGTPGYMSPEQAEGLPVDARSDVFSLGAVLFRALTGRPPFAGEDTPRVLYAIVYKAPPAPRELAPELPEDVDRVLALALAKRPSERFATAEELARALADAARGALEPALRERAARLLHALPFATKRLEEEPTNP